MRTTFLRTVRLIIEYIPGSSWPLQGRVPHTILGRRDALNENVSQVRVLADAVLLEFNKGREGRSNGEPPSVSKQSELRTFFLMQITLPICVSGQAFAGGRMSAAR